jgi:hypothetical protein
VSASALSAVCGLARLETAFANGRTDFVGFRGRFRLPLKVLAEVFVQAETKGLPAWRLEV